MIVNNYNLIRSLLDFTSKDDFYFVQIIQRAKENPDLKNNNKVIKDYNIKSIEHFNETESEIKNLCKLFNARAYICLTKRSFKSVALEMLQQLAKRIQCEQEEEVRRCFTTACGVTYQKKDKTWVVDIDEKVDNRFVNNVLLFIERECEPIGPKFKALVPTKNGWHLITTPFNTQTFSEKFPDFGVHKNSPTLLYYEW